MSDMLDLVFDSEVTSWRRNWMSAKPHFSSGLGVAHGLRALLRDDVVSELAEPRLKAMRHEMADKIEAEVGPLLEAEQLELAERREALEAEFDEWLEIMRVLRENDFRVGLRKLFMDKRKRALAKLSFEGKMIYKSGLDVRGIRLANDEATFENKRTWYERELKRLRGPGSR